MRPKVIVHTEVFVDGRMDWLKDDEVLYYRLLNPCLVGGRSPRSLYVAPDLTSENGLIPLSLLHVENVEGEVVWLRYAVGEA